MDAGADVDLIAECVSACEHVARCVTIDTAGCVSGCLETRNSIATPACEGLLREIFACIAELDCGDITASADGEPELDRTMCAGLMNQFEDDCAG